MGKNKIYVCDVLPCSGDLDVVIAIMEDETGKHNIQVCIPKYCEISKCIGEEIYYEMKNGRVRLSAVRQPKQKVETFIQDSLGGEG